MWNFKNLPIRYFFYPKFKFKKKFFSQHGFHYFLALIRKASLHSPLIRFFTLPSIALRGSFKGFIIIIFISLFRYYLIYCFDYVFHCPQKKFLPKAGVSSVRGTQGVNLYCFLDQGCNCIRCLYFLSSYP